MERDNRLHVLFPCRQSAHVRLGVVAVFDVAAAVFGFAVALFGYALSSSRRAWYRCSIRPRCDGIRLRPNLFTTGVVSLRYSTSRWWYLASPQSSSCPAWYRCTIRLRCGGIRLRPNLLHAWRGIVAVFDFAVVVFSFTLIFFTSSVVSLRYSTSLWQYSASS